MPRGRPPALSPDDRADIRRMYADPTRKESVSTLAHLFRVSPATIRRVLNPPQPATTPKKEPTP